MGHELADHLKEPAQEALAQVKDMAEGGVESVKGAAAQATATTKEHAQGRPGP